MPPPVASPLPLPRRPTRPPAEVRFNFFFWLILAFLFVPLIYELVIGEYRILYEGPWLGAFATLFLSLGVIHRFARLRIGRRFLRPYAGFRCPRCHYPLGNLPDTDICPECGTSYTRAGVVALWESFYRLGPIYPRASPGPPGPLDIAAIPSLGVLAPTTPSPARTITLQTALESIEAAARARGFSSPRFPAYRTDLDSAIASLGRPIPPDLYTMYAWFDPMLWSSLVRPAGAAREPESFEARAAEAQGDAVQIRHPTHFRAYGARIASPSRSGAPQTTPLPTLPAAWVDTPMVAFADTPLGHTILYCIDAPVPLPGLPAVSRGAIVALLPPSAADTSPPPLLLAPSLAKWLTDLAESGGQGVP